MGTDWDILGIGAAAVDDLLYVDHYPLPGSKLQVRAKRREGGGLTATALVAASRLGARTAYSSVLGEDELSRFTIQELERERVDCTPVLRQPEARPYHSIVIVDHATGERTILYSMEGVVQRCPEEITEDLIASCRVLFIDHLTASAGLHAIDLAHARGIPVVADVEQETRPYAMELMRRADHLIVGIALAERATGETRPERMVEALSGAERACCAVTAGERGCWYSERGGPVQHFPAFKVQVVDTTGCGDVFHGAYAACIARDESVAMAIQVASAAAGLKATQPGGRRGIPDRVAVDLFLKANQDYPSLSSGKP
jgi:sugar/nucleoside kinase (ribokinase family)